MKEWMLILTIIMALAVLALAIALITTGPAPVFG